MIGLMDWAVPEKSGWRKGPWTPEEDKLLNEYVTLHGEGRWSSVARCSGLNRNGKSCRLRWVNYLRPGLKRGQITPQEEGIIIELHAIWGNKWSTIARYLPGRTDNEIKNYWRTHFKKKERSTRKSSERLKSQNPKSKPKPLPLQPQPQQLEVEGPQTQTVGTNMLSVQLPVISSSSEVHINHQVVPFEGDKQDQIFMYPNITMAEQIIQNLMGPESPWMDAMCHDQDGLWWGGLWNFGDEAMSLQNQGTMTTTNAN